MSDILQEVLNEESDEKKLYYFKKILPIIIFLAVIVAIVMGVNNWYKDIERKNNQKNGDILIKSLAIINDNKELAIKSLESVAAENSKSREIALLQQVRVKITDKNYANAKSLLENIINNKEHSELTSSYARLLWLSLTIDESTVSNDERSKIQEYLQYFNHEDKAFSGTISIIKAILLIKNNSTEEAKKVLQQTISLTHMPQVVKEQAKALLTNIDIMSRQ